MVAVVATIRQLSWLLRPKPYALSREKKKKRKILRSDYIRNMNQEGSWKLYSRCCCCCCYLSPKN